MHGSHSPFEVMRLQANSYALLEARMVFMDTPKAACSSVKFALASIADVDVRDISRSLTPATIAELAIHDRELVAIPSLMDLHEAERSALLAGDDVLRFCFVRNPYARLASAWIDRILCHSLAPSAPLLSHLEFPEYRPDWAYLQARFAEYVDYLYRHEAGGFTNHHWQEQHALLIPHIMNYNLVVRLEELSVGVERLIAHTEGRGLVWPGMPRINETPFRYTPRLYTTVARRRVRELYADDFRVYGYDSGELPPARNAELPDPSYISAIQKRNRRVFHLSFAARGLL